ncbi:hypothetical protein EMIHUDRAFT_455112 [Emiliania huxleyi CCMP1516]|uniref:SAM domain-containing protein n=2 Tax=Emiliania huxleyi TaxID=2903 RepID=A0A0D3KKI3_EMIH1|nr:hypothetical protein EMIHUDRAFT_455112 [Emiliania huxleyi CCMP1516]EOD36268.1 hypothetical protein EMIHUDRAFT_455112 [Emiliania huxleyi CCMP1516]|eukprot:XP_005788697.1 hypothetical protein EMIHUDRAFT_455112 [Emiliania huxleyi CCMP1516]
MQGWRCCRGQQGSQSPCAQSLSVDEVSHLLAWLELDAIASPLRAAGVTGASLAQEVEGPFLTRFGLRPHTAARLRNDLSLFLQHGVPLHYVTRPPSYCIGCLKYRTGEALLEALEGTGGDTQRRWGARARGGGRELEPQPGLRLVPPVRLLRSEWVVARAAQLRAVPADRRRALTLPRRQELEVLEPSAYYSAEEVKALPRGPRNAGFPMAVLAVSHSWESEEHPDPHGRTLLMLADAITTAQAIQVSKGPYTWQTLPSRVAVFFDFCSLFQPPRAKEEPPIGEGPTMALRAALTRMQVWYAHQLTTCFFVTDGNTETANDGSHTPYHERGWPTFEYHVGDDGLRCIAELLRRTPPHLPMLKTIRITGKHALEEACRSRGIKIEG